MPLYDWSCEVCNAEETLILPFSEYDKKPEATSSDTCKEHKWVKVIKGKVSVVKAPGFGQKGYW